MFPWIFDHITKELAALAPPTREIKDDFPDGNINIDGADRFRCVQVLFHSCSTIHDTSF